MGPIVPVPDPLPLPAPLWLLQTLLVFTFTLHLLPMNFLLGGGLLAAGSHLRGRTDDRHARLARRLSELAPVVVAFTVTLGVAPLLFVQVLYGQFLYSSSILMANAWFAVIPLLAVAYYLVYLLRFKWESLGGLRRTVAWLTAGLVTVIGFIYANNFSLMLRPETWAAHYFAHPGGRLNWFDPALYPRFLHMLAGAVAVAGAWIAFLGARRRSGDLDWSRWACAYGARVFMWATVANVLIGLWFLVALPKRVMMIFMGQDMFATALLTVAILLAAVAWFLARAVARRPDGRGPALAGVALLVALLVGMALVRQLTRSAYLDPYFRLGELGSRPQWDTFALFAGTLVVGLAALTWLVRVALRARADGAA